MAAATARAAGSVRAESAGRKESRVTVRRSDVAGKRVITSSGARDLGEVGQLWVEPSAWRVVALSVRTSLVFGALDHVPLGALYEIGDVLLVPDDASLSLDFTPYGHQRVVGADLVTESGVFLGKARDFEFIPSDGSISRLFFDSLGIPSLPGALVSTYALPVSEVIASSPERVIVCDQAETKAQQLSMSLLQRLSLAEPPWEEAGRAAAAAATLDDNVGPGPAYDLQPVRRREGDAAPRKRRSGGPANESQQPQRAPRVQEQRQRSVSEQTSARRRRRSRIAEDGTPLRRLSEPSQREEDGEEEYETGTEGGRERGDERPSYEEWLHEAERGRRREQEYVGVNGAKGAQRKRQAFSKRDDML